MLELSSIKGVHWMTESTKRYKTYKIIPSGECPYDLEDFDEFKPECAFHTHLKLVEDTE